jgi:AcrR family transcriptional regulator/transposase-like protein
VHGTFLHVTPETDSAQGDQQPPDEDLCLDWLWRRRFSADGHTASCPRCGTLRRFHRLRARRAYACDRCGHQLYPTTDTPFSGSSTRLSAWFGSARLLLARGSEVSAREIQETFGLDYRTALRLRARLLQSLEVPQTRRLLEHGVRDLFAPPGAQPAGFAAPGPTPELRAQERRDRIAAAAARVFVDRGLADARVADIARAAGVSPAGVHYSFSTKQDLLVAALHWTQRQTSELLEAAVSAAPGPPARLAALVALALPAPGLLYDEYRLWLEVWVWVREHPQLKAREDALSTWRDALTEVVAEGAAQGLWIPVADPEVVAERLVALHNGLSFKVALGRGGMPLAQAREVFAAFVAEQLGLEPAALSLPR